MTAREVTPAAPRLFIQIPLVIATCAASALLMMLSTSSGGFLSGDGLPQPLLVTFGIMMLIGSLLAWRRWWAGAVLYLIGAAGILYLLNSVLPEEDRRFYADVLTLLNPLALAGTGALIVAALLDARQLLKRGLSLVPWSSSRKPDWLLIAYVILSIALLFITTTARGRPFHELMDRPMHGQSILTQDMLLAVLVLANQVILIALLLGQRWSFYALVLLLVLDLVLSTLLAGFALNFIVLRVVAIAVVYVVYNRNRPYFQSVQTT